MTTNEPSDRTPAPAAEAVTESHPITEPPAAAQPDSPRVVDVRRPSWLTRTVAVAGGVAAATFVLGGAIGFAVGHGDGDDRRDPAGFSRDGGPQNGHGPQDGFGPGFDGSPPVRQPGSTS